MKMENREFKDFVYSKLSRVAQAFSSPKRLEIIEILAQGERDVVSLARETSLTVANTSRHLQILKNTQIVQNRKKGTYVFYTITDNTVLSFWKCIRLLAEKKSAELREFIRNFFDNFDQLQPISANELLKKLRNKKAILIDVRPFEEYKQGHIKGAISIPLKELEKRIKEIPKDSEIIAYCRGSYCILASQAIRILRKNGFKAIRVKEGILEWKAEGFPLATYKRR